MNPYHRGSRLAALMPLFLAAAMAAPVDLSGPRYRPMTELEKERANRFDNERIEAARLKRKRKAKRKSRP